MRFAGYDDVNDADRLARNPAMRWIVGGRAVHDCAASARCGASRRSGSRVVRTSSRSPTSLGIGSTAFIPANRRGQSCSTWDSSVSPIYSDQEGTAYNSHFAFTCYRPLFVFNQLGELERCARRTVGRRRLSRSWPASEASSNAATSAPMPPPQARRSTSSTPASAIRRKAGRQRAAWS